MIINVNHLILSIITAAALGYCFFSVHPMLCAAYIIYTISSVIETIFSAFIKLRQQQAYQKSMQDNFDSIMKANKELKDLETEENKEV